MRISDAGGALPDRRRRRAPRRARSARRATLGLADRVRFLGWRRDLATIYGASDVFLLTSRNEGTPVALIESLAAGVPGVSHRCRRRARRIAAATLGVVVPFGDAAALASAVTQFLGDTNRRRAMGERGRVSVVARYGIDRLVDDIDALYRDLLRDDTLPNARSLSSVLVAVAHGLFFIWYQQPDWNTNWPDQDGYRRLGQALATTGSSRVPRRAAVRARSASARPSIRSSSPRSIRLRARSQLPVALAQTALFAAICCWYMRSRDASPASASRSSRRRRPRCSRRFHTSARSS